MPLTTMKFPPYELPSHFHGASRPYVVAHRGNRVMQPENSMAAFELALEQGALALETDLRLTADRVIVVHHDETVDRMSNGSGRIDQMTLEQLRALRLRNPDGSISDQPIPTFEEFLDAFAERTFFLLELKEPQWKTPEDVRLLVQMLDQYGLSDRVAIASFSFEILDCVTSVQPDLLVTPIMMFKFWPPSRFRMLGVIWPVLYMNPFYVWICRRRGQIFCPLDPTPESRLRYYRWLDVDFVLSDDPQKTIAKLKELSG